MEKKIRQNVFETNSSSTHSITVGDVTLLDTIYPDEYGRIEIYQQDFGWEFEKTNDPMTKASYVATQFNCLSKNLEKVIKDVTGAKEVYVFGEGSIDHESIGLIPDDYDFLKDFIFNKNTWLFTGNDNSHFNPNFYDVPIFLDQGVVNNKNRDYVAKLIIDHKEYDEENFVFLKRNYSQENIEAALDYLLSDYRLDEDGNFVSFYSQGAITHYYDFTNIDFEKQRVGYELMEDNHISVDNKIKSYMYVNYKIVPLNDTI